MKFKKYKASTVVKVIFFSFLTYQFLQNSLIWFYHDDYGYISLNYGIDTHISGMNYTLMDMFEYFKWHYLNWGGRVLFFFFFSLLARIGGLWLLRIVQTIIITTILYETYLLARGRRTDSPLLALTTALLWGAFSISVIRDGVYWFTASVLYTWPLVFFFAGVLVNQQFIQIKSIKLKLVLEFILFFLAGFSQEQIAILSITYCIVSNIQRFIYKKKVCLAPLAGAIVGGAIEILSPGNFARAGNTNNAAWFSLSLFEKIKINLNILIKYNFGKSNIIFVIIIFIIVLLGCRIIREKYKKTGNIFFILNLCYPVYVLLLGKEESILFVVIIGIWTINALLTLLYCCIIKKNMLLICLVCAAVSSQGMLLIVPSISHRTIIMFQYIMHIVALTFFYDYLNEIKSKAKYKIIMFYMAYIFLAFVCVYNGAKIGLGYYRNNTINKINNENLNSMAEKIKNGEDLNTVIYYKLDDYRYAVDMPYDKDRSYIEYWIKEYYQLPSDVKFTYEYMD